MKGIDFLRTMLTLRKPWVGWVMLLTLIANKRHRV